jgi:hypothetical protein
MRGRVSRLLLYAVTAVLIVLAVSPAFRSRVLDALFGAEHDFGPSAVSGVSHEMTGVSVRSTDSPREEPPPRPAGAD